MFPISELTDAFAVWKLMEERLLPINELILNAVVVRVELKKVRDEYPVAVLDVPFPTNIMEVE